MEKWAAQELQYADLGDTRRKKRLISIVENLASQPSTSVPQASGNLAAASATYDFWNSPYFHPSDIIAAQAKSTVERIKEHPIVLAVQDTTSLDFTTQKAKKGMGYLDYKKSFGLKVHTTLGVSAQGIPLGLINQYVWAREEKNLGIAKQRKKRETQEKESQRWLDSLSETQQQIPEDIQVVTIGDCEADIFDLFAQSRSPNSHLLIRGTHNRKVNYLEDKQRSGHSEPKYLHQSIREIKACGTLDVQVKRNPNHEARLAKLTVRFASFEIQVPSHHYKATPRQPVKLQVILAEEENPHSGVNPISWLLLTSLDISSFESAITCVRWYSYRWLIERYHFVLKSGCGLEKLQLETGRRIEMALATYSIVAWRLLWLTYQARLHGEESCESFLEEHEWQSLCATIHKKSPPPEKPPSFREAVRMIASLGGFLGRKGDGEPGVKTIWLGLRRLHDISQTWKLSHQISPPIEPP
ncbi:IS4 family transposase [Microcystis aeruginosa FBCC-A68]|nr:IS4 family transposase [Microcystis aeruginosa]